MKRLLLLLPLLLTAPVNAQVDPAVHEMCLKATDYTGCVQTQNQFKKANTGSQIELKQETKTWEEEYLSDPEWAKWAKENPEEAANTKRAWEEAQEIKSRGVIDNYTDCTLAGMSWDDEINKCLTMEGAGDKLEAKINTYNYDKPTGGCPPGTRQYQKTALFGLIKGAKLCLSDYEAESLRQAQFQNAITNMNQNMNRNRIIKCTSNT